MQTGARKRTSERSRAAANIPKQDRSQLTAGRVVGGHYRLARSLDHKGRIWLATDDFGREHVLKTGPSSQVEREYRMLAALSHPNIVEASECLTDVSGSFLVLEYLSGGDLLSLAGESPVHWLDPIAAIIDALDYLHGQGIVHRDVKARNVLFDAGGRPRLVDFESALPIGSRWSFGGVTPDMVQPDRGDAPVSTGDDVYALTCLLHEMLFGSVPGRHARKSLPAWTEALAQLVDAGLAGRGSAEGAGLDRFAAGVELVQAMRRNLQ